MSLQPGSGQIFDNHSKFKVPDPFVWICRTPRPSACSSAVPSRSMSLCVESAKPACLLVATTLSVQSLSPVAVATLTASATPAACAARAVDTAPLQS